MYDFFVGLDSTVEIIPEAQSTIEVESVDGPKIPDGQSNIEAQSDAVPSTPGRLMSQSVAVPSTPGRLMSSAYNMGSPLTGRQRLLSNVNQTPLSSAIGKVHPVLRDISNMAKELPQSIANVAYKISLQVVREVKDICANKSTEEKAMNHLRKRKKAVVKKLSVMVYNELSDEQFSASAVLKDLVE